jgi:hypothetical protein
MKGRYGKKMQKTTLLRLPSHNEGKIREEDAKDYLIKTTFTQ